jgi:hypothetical protein
MQKLDPRLTTWHITFGTYGTRLHGDYRATVDKKHTNSERRFWVETPFANLAKKIECGSRP